MLYKYWTNTRPGISLHRIFYIVPRDKPYQGPTKAIRSVRLDTSRSNGNKPSLTITPQARPQQASSKVSSGDSNLMDVDDEGYPVNYDSR
ncbi:hypothetical protein G6F61_013569 [Rhizopus arrhizus]|nr:hypothetical protein G6F61_013569 [Rhizopus arrhizus]